MKDGGWRLIMELIRMEAHQPILHLEDRGPTTTGG
jgi:hypothetical protein